jgi:hypothetical protein
VSDGPEWFARKRYGLGAGLPNSWQGWLVLVVYLVIVIGPFLLLGETSPATFAILIVATAIFLVIASRTTRGGWRWRWGKDDK